MSADQCSKLPAKSFLQNSSRHLLHLPRHLQLEQRGEYFARRHIQFQQLHHLVYVRGLAAFRSFRIFLSCGAAHFPPNRDAVLPACDSSPLAGVSASRTGVGSSSHTSSHVGGELGALFDQGVRSPGIFAGDIAGYGEHLSILFQRAARCDPGAALFGDFHHENDDRNATDDAIANGKALRCGKCVHGEFKDQGAAQGQHLLCEPGVFLG